MSKLTLDKLAWTNEDMQGMAYCCNKLFSLSHTCTLCQAESAMRLMQNCS